MHPHEKLKISTKAEEFFHVELTQFQDRRLFPFQLYIYNPASKQYSLFLYGNNPLTNDKYELLKFVLERGGTLAIRKDQQKTFITSLKLKKADAPPLDHSKKVSDEISEFIKGQKLAKKAINTSLAKSKFLFKEELQKSLAQDDFSNLISAARNEIAAFPCSISPTVSLARYLALDLLFEDNFYNRVVALSYFLGWSVGITDHASLGNLVCASFLYHLGNTQIDFGTLKRPSAELYDEERKKYRQHPGLTLHLLKKINLDLDLRCYQIILDHHERPDGSGFPNFKREGHIDTLGLVLGAVSHIFEYHYGLVTGHPTTLQNIFLNLQNKTSAPGLETEFGGQINQNLLHIIKIELLKDNLQDHEKNPKKNQPKVA